MSSNLNLYKRDYIQHQWDFLTSRKPITGLMAGFGSGKTHAFIRKVVVSHITKKTSKGISNGWVVYPTYDMAEELFVIPFKE